MGNHYKNLIAYKADQSPRCDSDKTVSKAKLDQMSLSQVVGIFYIHGIFSMVAVAVFFVHRGWYPVVLVASGQRHIRSTILATMGVGIDDDKGQDEPDEESQREIEDEIEDENGQSEIAHLLTKEDAEKMFKQMKLDFARMLDFAQVPQEPITALPHTATETSEASV